MIKTIWTNNVYFELLYLDKSALSIAVIFYLDRHPS